MTVTQKYLIYLSYIGTSFRGSQFQKKKDVLNIFPTVQGAVEQGLCCLLKLKGLRPIPTFFCSRTDAGVHALRTGFHVDLPPIKGKVFLNPDSIQTYLNSYFTKKNIEITVLEILKVPDIFNARFSAIEKVYSYRVGVLKKEFHTKQLQCSSTKPISECNRTFFTRPIDFNKDKVHEAAELFIGEKDFGAFIGNKQRKPDRSTICNIKSFNLKEAQPLMPSIDPLSQFYDYYYLTFKGERFLYHMVRKMVGVVLAVVGNQIPVKEVQLLFDKPHIDSWNPKAVVVPGHALYLLNVTFNLDHLIISEEEKNMKLRLLEEEKEKQKSEEN